MRIIDAKALIENRDLHIVIGAGDNICIDIADIAKAPTIDAVEVVRCKDCKWTGGKESVFCPEHLACNKWGRIHYVKPDDFCSYGERKTNGQK